MEIRNGEGGGFANRLDQRQLGLRYCVGASCFCLQLSWNGHFSKAHVPRMPFDDTVLRRRLYVLDLLPAQLAPAHADQAGHADINRDHAETFA